MKRKISVVVAVVILFATFVGVIPPVAVNSADNDATTRYTVLIVDTMGEYTISPNSGEEIVVARHWIT